MEVVLAARDGPALGHVASADCRVAGWREYGTMWSITKSTRRKR